MCERGKEREGGKGRDGGKGGREGGREGTIQHLAHAVGTRNLHTSTVLYQYHGTMQLLFSVCHKEVVPLVQSVHTANFTRHIFTTHTRSRPGKKTCWSCFHTLSLASMQAAREFSLTNQYT